MNLVKQRQFFLFEFERRPVTQQSCTVFAFVSFNSSAIYSILSWPSIGLQSSSQMSRSGGLWAIARSCVERTDSEAIDADSNAQSQGRYVTVALVCVFGEKFTLLQRNARRLTRSKIWYLPHGAGIEC